MAQTTLVVQGGNNKIMKTIQLNEQAVDWLKEHLNDELSDNDLYSETSKGIMRHILSKLEE